MSLSLLFSFEVFGQADPGDGSSGPCTGTTITSGLAVYNCTTLTITAGTYNFPRNPGPPVPPDPGYPDPSYPTPPASQIPVVRVKVQGIVRIDSGVVLNLSGEDGVSDTSETKPGGKGGPGADDGGGNYSATPENAPSGGATQGASSVTCGGGGGGGGFLNTGNGGSSCVGSPGGNGGNTYNINGLFRGGFGGATGGLGEFFSPAEVGTGGGGGGAIWISAGGDITINGVIDVSGGDGGAGLSDGGGGGGGSGGAIRIQSLGDIVNNATFNLAGGTGGAGEDAGARGGDGSIGLYQFEDADNVVYGTGTGATAFPGSSETFNSSISCGAVKMKDENNFVFQILLGFSLIALISRIRGQFRRSV